MTRVPLAGADLHDWITLRRVSGGGIARVGSSWFDGGRRVPGYVAETLAALREAGLVTLTDPDPMTMARTALTAAGADHFDQLCPQRHKALQARTAPLDATQPTGRSCSTCQ